LPATDSDTSVERKPSNVICKGKETVLLVDDEEHVIDVTQKMLECIGYEVIKASSGMEAIEIVRKSVKNRDKKIDLLILDMIMPEMGGGLTFDRIKEINPDLKVILSSGYSIKGEARKIMERGCDGFIQKPFKIAALSKKIKEVLKEEYLKKHTREMSLDDFSVCLN
jgi:CheY-like chemotaxis protein